MGAEVPKQYLPLLGRPVIHHTLERLCQCPAVHGVWAGISSSDAMWHEISEAFSALEGFRGHFEGGKQRAHTVLRGLEHIQHEVADTDWILVHDAARPCIRTKDIENLVTTVTSASEAGLEGGLLGLPVSDTVKQADSDHYVRKTVSREGLWRALTPQMFRFSALKQALEEGLKKGEIITDEASAIEFAGGRPLLVPSHADNIKITLPEDLVLAELYIHQQLKEGACA